MNERGARPEPNMYEDSAPPTVLLVEDDHDCRWLWRMLLDGDERFGRVTEVGSGREAVGLLLRDYPDIVITDVRMPGRSGLDLLDFLRSRYPTPLVVVTSACPDLADLAMARGASAFWSKVESVSPDLSERLWKLWRQHKSSPPPRDRQSSP